MGFLLKFALKTAANAAALWVADRYIAGFDIGPFAAVALPMPSALPMPWPPPHWQTIIALGIAIALFNLVLRPILKFAGALLPFATFAILSVALNAALLWTADLYLAVSIAGWKPLALTSLLLGAVNFFL